MCIYVVPFCIIQRIRAFRFSFAIDIISPLWSNTNCKLLCWNELRFNRKFMRINTLTPTFCDCAWPLRVSVWLLQANCHSRYFHIVRDFRLIIHCRRRCHRRRPRLFDGIGAPIVIHSCWNDHVNANTHSVIIWTPSVQNTHSHSSTFSLLYIHTYTPISTKSNPHLWINS